MPTFLRLLGLVYFVAFLSFGLQAAGLIGSHGILPLGDYLSAVRNGTGRAAYWIVPTLFWLNAGNTMLRAVCVAGLVCGLVAAWGYWQRAALAACLVLWVSLCGVGQDFLSFQWDVLLSEAGFLALFADPSPVRVWLFRWLIFRLMFSSGCVKLLSHDATWRNLTALSFHYETQPLPTPLAWYMFQLPLWFQKASTAFVFVAELGVPLLFFAPRPVRRIGAWITIALQLLILATGNYTFFNFLTIALTLFLFIEPACAPRRRAHQVVSVALAVFIGVSSGLVMLSMFPVKLPPGGSAILHLVSPLRIVNSYGLFAVMTTTRPEIIVEGSNDGTHWSAYEFRDKPGDLHRAPPVVEPFQPRLDWQMWFAALGSYHENRWFVNFMVRLLEGDSDVVRLLAYNPFPQTPPRYVRAELYLYSFTNWGDRAWWRRERQGEYLPTVSLKPSP
ncbi:MAG TPA: lipase maturation factor family protein [Bryobacteraceae bacterium]|nr:lipase maturation factor family protein [Bryobacteraceae bacterium]